MRSRRRGEALERALFGASLVTLIASVAYLLRENIISVQALELQLGSLPRMPNEPHD